MRISKMWKVLFIALVMIALAACGGNGTDEGTPDETAPGTTEETPDAGSETPEQPEEGTNETGETSLATQGEEAYQKSCISCHGANLEGGAGPALNNLTLSKEEIVDVIKNGRGSMPGNLAPGQEEAIADYLLSQQ